MNYKILFVVCSLSLSLNVFAQAQKKAWDKDSSLSWIDFKAIPDPHNPYYASTVSGSEYFYKVFLKNGKYILTFKVICNMDKNKSWSVPSKQTPYLLKHEQIHFDIDQIFSKKLENALSGYNYTKKFKEEVVNIVQKVTEERDEMQSNYDLQTKHSLNKIEQSKWEAYVLNTIYKF